MSFEQWDKFVAETKAYLQADEQTDTKKIRGSRRYPTTRRDAARVQTGAGTQKISNPHAKE